MIVGHRGFVGKNLVKHLAKKHHVIEFSGDIADADNVNFHVSKFKPDAVINLAAYGNSPYHKDDPIKVFKVNLVGTANFIHLLDLGFEFKFIQAGTSSEYGVHQAPLGLRARLKPSTDYAKTKACCSILLQDRAVVLRLFTIYGPYEHEGRLIPTVINNALNNKRTTVYEGAHDYVYIKDACRAFEQALDTEPGIYHVATAKQYSNIEVAAKIKDIVHQEYGYEAKIKDVPGFLREYDSPIWVSDEESILPGWKPKTSLEKGLTKTVRWWGERQ